MRNRLPARCADINTPYCPCILADTNHCVYCSQLKGEAVCNCNWSGVCILNEKSWQSKSIRKNNNENPYVFRTEMVAPILEFKLIADNTYYLLLKLSPELAHDLDRPGAFVFIRRDCDPDIFKFPVGVMYVDQENVGLVVETIGPKSSQILNHNGSLIIRAPYYNGVLGGPWIDKLSEGKVILLAGGLGQPPALPIAKTLLAHGNRITAILAPGKTGKVFISDTLSHANARIITVKSMRSEGLMLLREMLNIPEELPDLLVSAGPDEQHFSIASLLQNINIELPMAATNNATMCCGEGVCGSCDKESHNGSKVRTCKTQTDFLSFI